MSFKDMPHNLQDILDHLSQGTKELTALNHFFKGIKKAYDDFSIEFNRLTDSFFVLKPEGSLTKSLHILKKCIKQSIGPQLQFISSLQSEIIEPLDLFSQHFTSNNSSLALRVETFSKPTKSAYHDLQKSRISYYDHCESLERLKRTPITPASHSQFSLTKANLEKSIPLCQNAYVSALNTFNLNSSLYESAMPELLESLQQNEESRIHFIKSSSEKFVRFHQKLTESNLNSLSEFSDSIGFINSAFDIKNFIGRLQNPMIVREEFVDYEHWKSLKKIEDVSEAEIVNSVVEFLVLGKSGKFADFGKLEEIVKKNVGREMLLHGLEVVKHNEKVENEGLKKLAEILKRVLAGLEEDESGQMQFCKIIAISHVFYSENQGNKQFLTELLGGEKLWDNEKRWISAIQIAISAKLMVDKETSQRLQNLKKKPGFLLATLKDFAQKLPLGKEKTIEKNEKSSIYNVLSQFTYQMSNLGVSSKIAHSIIIKLSDIYSLERERVCSLLSQIQVDHKMRENRLKTAKHSRTKAWRLVLEFLDVKSSLEILCTEKRLNKDLRPYVYNNFIVRNLKDIKSSRRALWVHQLQSHFPPTDYYALLEKVIRTPEIIEDNDSIIDMDIHRSYQDKPQIHQTLRNILKTYAFYNPDVSYCQGMNFIAGTFLLLLQDESLSFKCLIGLVTKFKMGPIFQVGVPKLKCMLYQLDQLIEIRLPAVMKVFKLEGVSSGFFSSSWFLTLFSSNLQNRVPVLLRIWDLFFIKGWKIIFKASIAILSILEHKIVRSGFDEIMHLITGSSLYSEEIFNLGFVEILMKIKVSNSLLTQLENDYDNILQLSNRVSN